eukprot:gnl/TRDRNA2_/TRDRNA2_177619_c14_seq3.p1 gnl/TRDRNA2_/TRDRNA2_177619_c14~~gnl/TRDRNA2_/TRDRNA2_177619_c14_seq3.p1  ORF type:complete len:143 (-),score=10.12 gnl/TRDRNA2_/TRDRNA2_177619_c14_seq3:118-546(-)
MLSPKEITKLISRKSMAKSAESTNRMANQTVKTADIFSSQWSTVANTNAVQAGFGAWNSRGSMIRGMSDGCMDGEVDNGNHQVESLETCRQRSIGVYRSLGTPADSESMISLPNFWKKSLNRSFIDPGIHWHRICWRCHTLT